MISIRAYLALSIRYHSYSINIVFMCQLDSHLSTLYASLEHSTLLCTIPTSDSFLLSTDYRSHELWNEYGKPRILVSVKVLSSQEGTVYELPNDNTIDGPTKKGGRRQKWVGADCYSISKYSRLNHQHQRRSSLTSTTFFLTDVTLLLYITLFLRRRSIR